VLGETEGSRELRILLVDDDPFTRVTLAATVKDLGLVVVADASSVTGALRKAREVRFDVALIDLDLGEGPTGIDLARGLRRMHRNMPIVMLSTYAEPRLIGVNAPELPPGVVYVVKASVTRPEVLGNAIRMAMETQKQVETRTPSRNGSDPLRGLSDQQIEILRLLAAGLSNAEIANRRFINERSVEKAIARLARHFNVESSKSVNQRVLVAQMYSNLTGRAGAPQA
jgi:DNA-binding NarL/FixJ family response regulator